MIKGYNAMSKSFQEYLSDASTKIRKYNMDDVFQRRKDISTYYWNCASDLHATALIFGHAREPNFCMTSEDLGLGKGFSLALAISPPFWLNAGMSIELLLKAIGKVLDRPEKHSHSLNDLCQHVGIQVSDDVMAILNILTESIYWSGRYPVPKTISDWERASQVWSNVWSVPDKEGLLIRKKIPERQPSLSNYEMIWDQLQSYYRTAKEIIHEP